MKTRSALSQRIAALFALLCIAATAFADNGNTLEMRVGRSAVVEAPWPVAQVSVAEPAIADVQVARANQIVILAKATGETDVVLWSDSGEVYHKVVRVSMDLSALTAQLNRFFPTANLDASQYLDVVTVSGTFRSAEESARLRAYLDASGMKYADMTTVAGVQQVLIKVKIAEASRQALRSLGVDTFYSGKEFQGGLVVGDLNPTVDIGPESLDASIGAATTMFGAVPSADIATYIEALEDNQYLRILAEPSLIALSGEEASFLAGGEFPIPVVQGSTGGGNGSSSITIEFKEFGVRLKFKPVVLGDGSIQLKVAPEVSSLSDVGAIQIEGFSIPSLTTRRAETTLRMHSGQTFAMAGLLDQETRAQSEKVPGLGNMPILGSLFRSVRYQNHDSELVVLATVELVEPSNNVAQGPLPGDLHAAPSDWELYANGRIEGRTPRKLGPVGEQWMKSNGLNELAGPGAWESNNAATPQITPQPVSPAAVAEEAAATEEAQPAAEPAASE